MGRSTLNRRSLLKLLGLSAGALGFASTRRAFAGNQVPRRLIVVTSSHGLVRQNWSLSHLFPGSLAELERKDWETPLADLDEDAFSEICLVA